MTYEECNIASYTVGNTPTELKRERGSLVSPHHNRWNFHRGPTNLKILPSLNEGRQTPSITVKQNGSWPYWAANQQPTLGTNRRSFWALSVYSRSSGGLRPPCHHPRTRSIILRGRPMSLSEAIAFNSHGANLLTAFPAFTVLTHPSLISSIRGGTNSGSQPYLAVQKSLSHHV